MDKFVDKAAEQATKKELADLLKSHDWYYEYSDDHRYWKSGSESRKKIHSYREKLGDEVYKEIYNEHAPDKFKIK